MKTYMELAQSNEIVEEFTTLSKMENVFLDEFVKEIATGASVIIPNRIGGNPVVIGKRMRSKILCNLGTSSESPNISLEIRKAKIALDYGADIICDQSVGKDIKENRRLLIQSLKCPIASVPLYQNVDNSRKRNSKPLEFNSDEIIATFEEQISNGVSMPGIHSMTSVIVNLIKNSKRLMPIVSRGAGIMYEWINKHKKENPYFKEFDKILSIAHNYNVPLTFICSLRSGTILDGFDKNQVYEWDMLKEYIQEAHSQGISVLVDGIGHVAINHIPSAIKTFKKMCFHVPLGVLGPAVTDRGLGHEHIVNAIGTAVAIQNGANYCNACYRTEHLGLPQISDISEGISASLIAAYCGDLGKRERRKSLLEIEKEMSTARRKNQWGIMLHYAIEQNEAINTFKRVGSKNLEGKGCSICGDLCPFVVTGQVNN